MRPPLTRPPPGTPLYLHLPFCTAKCTYCDFYSLAEAGQDQDGALDALLLEAQRSAPQEPKTVFLGGGTPSLLSAERLRRLLDRLEELTGFRGSAREVTAECNPESLDRAKADTLRELGVDRLSIGIQSLDPATLEMFGRVHTVDQGFAAFRAARAAGFERLSVDMIHSWPGQETAAWRGELERVLDLEPDHFSAYNLTFEEGTTLTALRDQGRVVSLPEETELELFHATRSIAAERGLEAYEISNFSRPGEECLHNLEYWHNRPYVGLGPSAVSRVGWERYGNPRSLTRWRAAVEAGNDPREWEESPAPEVRLGETWWLGLRLAAGVAPGEARETAGWEAPADPAVETARALSEQGLLEERSGRWQLTRRGLPLADAIATRFLPDAQRS